MFCVLSYDLSRGKLHVHLRRRCILGLLVGMFYIYQTIGIEQMGLSPMFPFDLLYDLSIADSGVITSYTITVLSVSPLFSVSICLVYFGTVTNIYIYDISA